MKRVAVVDIGSGTTTLAIFQAGAAGFLDRVHQEGRALRLIEKLDARGRLTNGAARGLLSTVSGYVKTAQEAGAERTEIVATSAMRDAVNGPELVAELGRLPKSTARLISGEEEGRLAAHTVVCTLPLQNGVVMDLGGGSLQLARVVDRVTVESVSFPLGALRLYDAFLAGTDPPTADGLVALRRHVVEQLRRAPWLLRHGGTIVAVGGGARSLGKMHRRSCGATLGHGHGYRLDSEIVLDQYEYLSRVPAAARAMVPGLPEHRTDTIVAASLILSTVLRIGGFGSMYLSTYGIREGVAFRSMLGEDPIGDPAGAGIQGRLGVQPARPPVNVPGLSPRELRLFVAAMGHPPGHLLEKPIQGYWQEEVLRVVEALRLGVAGGPVAGVRPG